MGADGVGGVDMANIKNIDGATVPPVSITLLADLDFTTMPSADWTGDSTVSLNGQTWTIGYGGASSEFGPNGSSLIFTPKTTGYGDWWSTARTGTSLSIKLSSLDASVDADATYITQTVCNEFPDGINDYARFFGGFWSDVAASKGYTCLFGVINGGSPKLYCYLGGTTDNSSVAADEDELTFYTYLNPSGFNEVRVSDSADGNTPLGGDSRGVAFASNGNPGSPFTLPSVTRTLTASADVNLGFAGVGTGGYAGPTYKIDRLRVWKLKAST